MLKKQKVLMLSLIILSAGILSFAHAQNSIKDNKAEGLDQFASDLAKESQSQTKIYEPVWQKATNCEPANSDDNYIQILGFVDNKCHIKYGGYDCFFDVNALKEYTSAALRSIQETYNSYDSEKSPSLKVMNGFHTNVDYCNKIE